MRLALLKIAENIVVSWKKDIGDYNVSRSLQKIRRVQVMAHVTAILIGGIRKFIFQVKACKDYNLTMRPLDFRLQIRQVECH